MKDEGKCKVFLHTRDHGQNNWTNNSYNFARIPVVGEHLTTGIESDWYEVQLVVHTPYPCDCDAEVYAVKVDHMEAQKAAMPDVPWA
jgi:hypothetical protein